MCVILIFNIHDVTTRLCSDDAHLVTDRSNITFLNRAKNILHELARQRNFQTHINYIM